MKEQDSQEQGALISELIANLLRDRLASKLPESVLTSLISETKEIVKTNQTHVSKVSNTASSSAQASEAQADPRISKLKDSIDYIEYKCREIERTLRTSDRHVRRPSRERVFRDRSPLGMFGDLYGDPRPVRSSLTITRSPTASIGRSHNPWFDNFS